MSQIKTNAEQLSKDGKKKHGLVGKPANNKNWKGGQPPIDSKFRCQAKFKRDPNKICPMWAMKGSSYCYKHGGRKKRGTLTNRGRIHFVTSFYSHLLGPSLTKFINNRPGTSKETLQIHEELEVARLGSMAVVRVYSFLTERLAVLERTNLAELDEERRKQVTQEMRQYQTSLVGIGSELIKSMERVGNLAEKAYKISSASEVTFTPTDIHEIVEQIKRVMDEVCGEEYGFIAQRFDMAIREKLRLPGKEGKVEGSLVNPDALMQEMADSMVTGIPIPKLTVSEEK